MLIIDNNKNVYEVKIQNANKTELTNILFNVGTWRLLGTGDSISVYESDTDIHALIDYMNRFVTFIENNQYAITVHYHVWYLGKKRTNNKEEKNND